MATSFVSGPNAFPITSCASSEVADQHCLNVGRAVCVRTGAMQGTRGVVVSRVAGRRLMIRLLAEPAGIHLEIDRALLELEF